MAFSATPRLFRRRTCNETTFRFSEAICLRHENRRQRTNRNYWSSTGGFSPEGVGPPERNGECHDGDFSSLALRPPISVDPSCASEPVSTTARRTRDQTIRDPAPRSRGGQEVLNFPGRRSGAGVASSSGAAALERGHAPLFPYRSRRATDRHRSTTSSTKSRVSLSVSEV